MSSDLSLAGIDSNLPPADELSGWIREMNAIGPRLAGTTAHQAFIDLLARHFRQVGADVIREPFALRRWEATHWSLTVTGRGQPISVPVASYYPESGATTAEGVEGSLVYLGDALSASWTPDEVQGRIVLVDYLRQTSAAGYGTIWGTHNPRGDTPPTGPSSDVHSWFALEKLRLATTAAGARAMIIGRAQDCDESAAGMYHPVFAPSIDKLMGYQTSAIGAGKDNVGAGVPALWVGPTARRQLLDATPGAKVRLVLQVVVHPHDTSDGLIATLSGAGPEAIVLATHTDGLNAIQENGPIGLLALARTMSGIAHHQRRRTLIFACGTGHLSGRRFIDPVDGAPALAETEGLVQRHPALTQNAVAAFAVEHLGATQWEVTPTGVHPTGQMEWGRCFTTNAELARVLLESLEGLDCPTVVAQGRVWGMAIPFLEAGVPAISYGTTPEYLLQMARGGHLNRWSQTRMLDEVRALARALRKLDTMPRSQLSAAGASRPD